MRSILLFFVLPLLAGCGGGSGSGTLSNPLSASVVTPSGLTAMLSEDVNTVTVGASPSYTIILANHTGHNITYNVVFTTTAPISDESVLITVKNAAGQVVGDVPGPITPVLGPAVTLAAGQSISSATRLAFPASGHYTVTATFTLQTDAAIGPKSTDVGPLSVTVQ